MKKLLILSLVLLALAPVYAQWPYQHKPNLGKQIDWSHPLADGLVVFYLENESVGDKIYDSSGNENHISFSSSSTVWGTCELGSCLVFDDGATGGIIGTGAKALPANKGSFSVWVSVDALVQNDAIITLHDGTNQERIFMFYNSSSNPDSQLQLNSNVGGVSAITWYISPVPTELEQAGWLHHIVATWDYDSDDVNVYLNGQQLTPTGTAASGIPSGLDQISLGSFHAANIFTLDGQIASASVYDRVLSKNEAVWLYRTPFGFMQDDLPVSMMFDFAPEVGQFIFISTIPFWLLMGCLIYRGKKCQTK
jgi:hypothetical protein